MSSFRVFASCLIVSFALYQIQLTYGYGILQLFPPARGSLWRMNLSRTSIDYNDEYMNCGGFAVITIQKTEEFFLSQFL